MKKRFTFYLFLVGLSLCLIATSQAQNIEFLIRAGSAGGNATGKALVTDASGNLYVTGSFAGSVTFGSTTLVSAGDRDIFIAKFSSTGSPLWARRAGGSTFDDGSGIIVSSSGVYVTGYFSGTANFPTPTVPASNTLSSAGNNDIFVASYDASTGEVQWLRRAGGTSNDLSNDIAVNSSGVYVTGYFDGTANFPTPTVPSNTLNSAGGNDIFVAKYDASGEVQWLRRAGGSSSDLGNGIVVDNSAVYVTGQFLNTANFPTPTVPTGNTLTSAGSFDIFVAKYDESGEVQWLRRAGSSSTEGSADIAVNSSGVYVTGYFSGTANFPTPTVPASNTLSSAGNNDIFVASYDASTGEVLWLRRAGGSDFDSGNGIAVDNSGVYVTGDFKSTANFNTPSDPASNTLSSAGGNDIFVAKYNALGEVLWLRRGGSSEIDSESGIGISVDNSMVYVTGVYIGTADFNTPSNNASNTLTALGASEVFIAKWNQTTTSLTLTGFAASPTTVCAGIVTTFTATVGNVTGSYDFTLTNGTATSTGSTTSTAFSQSWTAAGSGTQTLSLIVSDGNSATFASTTLTVKASPSLTVTASKNFTVSGGQSVTLTASGASSYSWNTSETSATISVSTAGTYSVTGVSAGCSSTTSVTVSIGNLSIGDRVYFDRDGDGIQDVDEPGIPGAQLIVTYDINTNGTYGDAVDQSYITLTGVDGIWTVNNLNPGKYRVAVTPPAGQGWAVTDAFDNEVISPTIAVTPSLTVSLTFVDFGFRSTGSIDSRVWADTNGDGVQDANEPGIPNVKLTLRYDANANNTFTDADDGSFTTLTGATGGYSFSFLPPGTYQVVVTPSTLPDNSLSTDDLDGITTPNSSTATLTLGQSLTTVNFGYNGNSTIGGRVWFDANRNRVDNTGEPGLSGILVTLTFGGNDGNLSTTTDNLSFTTTTDASGAYNFTALFGGDINGSNPNYRVTVTRPAGFTVQTYDASSPTTDNQSSVTLVNNGSNLLQSFGYAPTCTSVVYVTETGAGLQNGSSWANAYPGTQLQTAIDAVSACGGGQVWVAAGIYKPTTYTGTGSREVSFQMRNTVAIYGGFAGTETALTGPGGRTLTMPGSGQPSSTTFSGEIDNDNTNTNNSLHVVLGAAVDNTARLDGVVITRGNADNPINFGQLGGGIAMLQNPQLAQNPSGILANCTIESNTATYGGGLCNYAASPSVINCVFRNNVATVDGGGIYSYFGVALTLTNTVLQSNSATSGGGGLYSYYSIPLLTNCTLKDNAATAAGAILHQGVPSQTLTLTLTNSIVWNNGESNSFSVTDGVIGGTYSLFDPASSTIAGFDTSGPGNLTTTASPFAGLNGTQLAPCSPAIDAGNNAAFTGVSSLTTDLASNARFYNNGTIDMGAYEFAGEGQPTSFSVLGSGTATCSASPTITLTGSETGVSYQLQLDGVNSGTAVDGTGSSISFGTQPQSGTYTVLATRTSNSCSLVMPISATVVSSTAVPTVSISATSGTLTCAVTSVTLTATTSETALLWSNGSTANSITVNTAATFSVTVTNASGCSAASNSLTISQNTAPPTNATLTANVGGTLTCQQTTLTLTAAATGSSLSYVFGGPSGLLAGSGASRTVTTSGVYSVTITGANGCTTAVSTTVYSDTVAPSVSLLPTNATLTCGSPTLTLTATSGLTNYSFSSGQNGASHTLAISTADIYSVVATGTNGCTNVTSATVVSSTAVPSVSISASSGTLTCGVTSVTLTATTSETALLWSNGSTARSITVNTAATYSVTVTNASGCTVASNSLTISQNTTAPTNASLTAGAGGTLTCAQTTLTLTASASGSSLSYVFGGPSGLLGGSGATRTVSTSGVYSVTITGANGCSTTVSTTVYSHTSSPSLSITPSSSTLTCASPTVSLSAIGNGTILWSTGASTTIISASTAGTYSVTLTDASGCRATTSAVVSGTVLRAATVTADGPVGCGRTSALVSISATGATSFTLLGPGNFSAINTTGQFSVTAGGSYTGLAGQSGGCVASGEVTVAGGGIQPSASNFRASGALGAGSCTVRLLGTGTGNAFVMTGPGGADASGYVFSNVYRNAGTYPVEGRDVRLPGTYTLTVYSGSCVATYTTVVTGTACSSGQ